MPVHRGVSSRWVTPTLDDIMFAIAQDTWWNRKDKAKERLIWLMEWMQKNDNYDPEEAKEHSSQGVSESEEKQGEKGEDGSEGPFATRPY